MDRRRFIGGGAALAAAVLLPAGPNETEKAWAQLRAKAEGGVVSMEELRGHFAQKIPGLLDGLARELKIEAAELLSLVREGKLRWSGAHSGVRTV